MTMHMMGHAYDTVYRGRRKVKITKSDHARLEREWLDYNKFAGKNHLQKVTFTEYVDSAFGHLCNAFLFRVDFPALHK